MKTREEFKAEVEQHKVYLAEMFQKDNQLLDFLPEELKTEQEKRNFPRYFNQSGIKLIEVSDYGHRTASVEVKGIIDQRLLEFIKHTNFSTKGFANPAERLADEQQEFFQSAFEDLGTVSFQDLKYSPDDHSFFWTLSFAPSI